MYSLKLLLLTTFIRSSSNAAVDSCGISTVSKGKVIAGEDAVPGQWPWQAAIFRKDKGFICGGALIRPTWVLTAAHCIEYKFDASLYRVTLGDHNIFAASSDRQNMTVKKVIMHETYNQDYLLNNDIALIELSQPAFINTKVRTICLPKKHKDIPVDTKCFLSGWGKVSAQYHKAHPILQQGLLPIISRARCQEKVNNTVFKFLTITKQMLCAEDIGKKTAGCHGDSGGPLSCDNGKGQFVLQGLVSWGSPTCDISHLASVYVRVSEFIDWIETTIEKSKMPPLVNVPKIPPVPPV